MKPTFKKATLAQIPVIWNILKHAIAKRKEEGSTQWQDGYPNTTVLEKDIQNHAGYVLIQEETIIGYCALLINDEPEYDKIIGQWLTNSDFVVFHRVAIAPNFLGKGYAKVMLQHIEEFALSKNILSIKADTNFDNQAMLTLFEKAGYVFCGEVYFRGSPRKAYEKVLESK